MTNKEQKNRIKQLLENAFIKSDNIKFYFLKKSKVKSEFEHKILFKTKKKLNIEKLKPLQKKIQNQMGEKWEFGQWSQFVGELFPESKVYKVPFFDTSEIEIKNPWRVCPVGEHWVQRHPKHLKTGKITDHDGHCRKNPSKKDLLKGDEMDLIANSKRFLNPKVKVSKADLKIRMVNLEKQNKYDDLISGWTAYWNDIFQLKDPLHPNHVKALIATESKFKPNARAKNPPKIRPARGLMQITERTTRWAKDHKLGEYRDHFIDLEYEDLWAPNRNIAFGIRQIFRKKETTKWVLKREPSWFEVLMDYKGLLKSNSKYAKTAQEELQTYFKQMGLEYK